MAHRRNYPFGGLGSIYAAEDADIVRPTDFNDPAGEFGAIGPNFLSENKTAIMWAIAIFIAWKLFSK